VHDFSKMEAGKYTLQSVPFDPMSVVQESRSSRPDALTTGDRVVYRCDHDIPHSSRATPTAPPDPQHLVGNARQVSDEGENLRDGSVDSRGADGIVLRTVVQDSGVGISEADQQRLSRRSPRWTAPLVRRHGGTGLGLVISKRLVEMMGGQIGVKSERGVGSTFWFTIKVTASDAPGRPAQLAFPSGHRALIVEASRRWCHIIEEHMTAWGLSCSVQRDGLPALETLRRSAADRPFDLVVVGARLRDVTIESFVKQVRQIPTARKLPLIVLTQLGETATLSEIEKEITAQVAKPLRLSELYECIQHAFSDGTRVQTRTPRPQARRKRGRGRILIVDENETNQFVALEQVEFAGYEADVAVDGREAVRMVQQREYAVVLMDCQMPVMDGYTATREIRAWEGDRRHTPIIALTAHAMAGERDKVLSAGMDDYLSKPLKPHALEKMLERYTARGRDEEPPSEPSVVAAPPPPEEPARAPVELDLELERSPRLSSLFLARTPEILVELDAAVAAADATRIRDRAHKLKGSCLAVGAEVWQSWPRPCSSRPRRGTWTGWGARAEAIRAQFERVSVLLHRELDSFEPRRSNRPSSGGSDSVSPPRVGGGSMPAARRREPTTRERAGHARPPAAPPHRARRWLLVSTLGAALATSLGCGAPVEEVDADAIVVGAALPFTGEGATIGQNLEQALLLAVEDVNRAGGVGGRRLRLVSRDSNSGTARGLESVLELLYLDEVRYLIGPDENELAREILSDLKGLDVFEILPGYASPSVQREETRGRRLRLPPSPLAFGCGISELARQLG
jgi:polar amino acid transport system substrate-binding protein